MISLLIAIIGALIGIYGGTYFQNMRQELKMKEVRGIAIKALMVLKNGHFF